MCGMQELYCKVYFKIYPYFVLGTTISFIQVFDEYHTKGEQTVFHHEHTVYLECSNYK